MILKVLLPQQKRIQERLDIGWRPCNLSYKIGDLNTDIRNLLMKEGILVSKIKINNLKHIKRNEENEILEYISEQNRQMHVAPFWSIRGRKTEISLSSLKFLGEGDLYSGYTILQYDASQISENCTNDLFYSSLTYKLIQKSFSNDIDLTRVSKENTFLSYLEKSSYKEDIKTNAKKALIASLSLLPTIGPVIYDLLNVSDDNSNKSYQTVQFVLENILII